MNVPAVSGNPILHRELLDRLRSWKTAAAILAVAVVSSGLVMLRWPTDATVDIVSQGTQLVFRPLACALTLAVMMLVPAFPATSLVAERRRGTLALLLNSPLSAWQIYCGKLLSNVLLSLVLISVSLPALGACLAMGGITMQQHVGPLLLVLIALAVQYSAVGLWISIRSSTADASLRWTYVAIMALAVLSVGPLVLTGTLSGIKATLAQILTAVSPISALQQITASQASVAELGLHTGWMEFLIASCLVTAILAILTIRKLDPILLDRPRPAGKIVSGPPSLARRMAYLVDPERRKSGIAWWLNPILVKEFRTRKFGRLHWLIRLVSICAIVSLMLTVVAATGTVSWGVERIAGPLVLMQIGLLLLVGPSLGANLIAAEVESGGWQLLRVSPISTIRVLSGKLMSVVWTLLLVLLATLPGYLVMSYIQPSLAGQISNVVVSLLFAVALVVSISATVSAFCRSTAVATATSYGILLTLFAGTLLIWMARGKPFGPIFVERVLMFNPAALALSEMGAPGFQNYDLTPGGWWVSGVLALVCLLVLSIRTWLLTRPD
ncbi:ABC transporter permease subunit [Aureliella helgolandensis]|uniref:ABC-2 family transporter protein n=1 Tax=Aureliella helgolandensis TaxID=2527968 RepID=A0A518GA78_9BACT|nr:ABC transporter permease subunit [Aureliella helgolandensis]QDV25469.1 ABC-2 family transporter protein [Aureliella helgolandensis]